MYVLLIHPWIHDFAAYDLWIQPLGLLYLGAILEENGVEVGYVNCLDSHEPRARQDGRGKFTKHLLPKPVPVAGVQRRYGRYGITPDDFRSRLARQPRPDAVLVTSGMTYWYPGVQETIGCIRTVFPDSQVLLGGIYASLTPEHAARFSGADRVVPGQAENRIVEILRLPPGRRYACLDEFPLPLWRLTGNTPYRVLLTSRGCPYRCSFCASPLLHPDGFRQRTFRSVAAEIKKYYYEDSITEFVFADDALLAGHERFLQPLLRTVIEQEMSLHFHTPNGLHAREITQELAGLMFLAGFRTIRLSLESVDRDFQESKTGGKVDNLSFARAVKNLCRAGYSPDQLEAYLMMGLPGQKPGDVRNTLDFVAGLGVLARPAVFSPIPGTAEAEAVHKRIGEAFQTEPLLQNDSCYPIRECATTVEEMENLKRHCLRNNSMIRANRK
jgi:radical SAM superfamily enzyme YgiQ (UPF0313 family)